MTTYDLVEQLIRQNPELAKNTAYLILEVWDRQGLKLYPNQRDLFLKGNLAASESISRSSRKVKLKMKSEQQRAREQYAHVNTGKENKKFSPKKFKVKVTHLQ